MIFVTFPKVEAEHSRLCATILPKDPNISKKSEVTSRPPKLPCAVVLIDAKLNSISIVKA